MTEETKSNLKTVAELYKEGLSSLALVVYHLHKSTGQNIRSIVRNMVAKDILTAVEKNKPSLENMYDTLS